jgi:vinculin
MNPNNQASVEHFELLKKQWTENAEKLRALIDEAVDTAAFICANGKRFNCQLCYG